MAAPNLLLPVIGTALAFSGSLAVQAGAQNSTAAASGCARGEPEALLSSQSRFKRTAALEAEETVQIALPVKLKIRHYGCAHYGLSFEFARPAAPGPQFTLRQAAVVLRKLPVKEEYASLITRLAAALQKISPREFKEPLILSEMETAFISRPAPNLLLIRYDMVL